jgi:iron complex transport system substrate-binding protein
LEDLSIEEIIQEDPDFIFVTTMGDEQKAIEALKNGIETNPAWKSLSAVENDRYIILPKELFHYKPNAKWGESYRYLAEIIYPEIFN